MMMIDLDDSQIFLALDRQAKNLAVLDDRRLERALGKIHERAKAQFIAAGDDELGAWFRADAFVQRLLSLIANHKRRMGRAL